MKRSHTTMRLGAAIGVALATTPQTMADRPADQRQENAQRGASANMHGQTVTTLADGRVLVLGGVGPGGLGRDGLVSDPMSGAAATLPRALVVPRAWHTATLMPDGTVLVIGGLDEDGRLVETVERLDVASEPRETSHARGGGAPRALNHVATGRSSIVTRHTPEPRARHTATLLTDGSVLIAGGLSPAGAPSADAQLWNPEHERPPVSIAAEAAARVDHRAALLADGSVRLSGGRAADDREVGGDLIFDPGARAFVEALAPPVEERTFYVVTSLPADDAVDVPLESRLALRFSRPLPSGRGTDAITLTGPSGPVAVRVVVAEEGRLLFVNPAQPLAPGAAYVLSLDNVTDRSGVALGFVGLRFTTIDPQRAAAEASLAQESDDERLDERELARSLAAPPLQAGAGVTALAGRTLTLKGNPLAGVIASLGTVRSVTDGAGRFLLAGVPAGRRELVIDARPASTNSRTYGVFMIAVDLEAGMTTELPYTIWMPALDVQHAIPLPSPTPSDFVARTPRIPGLEVHIPAGAVLRDADGQVVGSMTITRIPIDRPPFPLPRGVRFPVYFTLQPGGARIEGNEQALARGIRLIFPNVARAPAKARIDFWSYDSKDVGWFRYGQGTVTADGRQVVPDPGVVIRQFTCASLMDVIFAAGSWWAWGGGRRGGDPVDLSTGLFEYTKTDLMLPDVIPVTLTRTYRPNDPQSRPFGIGATHDYELFLVGDRTTYTYAELIMPAGERVRYDRISPGTGYTDAVMEHTTSPTAFYKSRLSWNATHAGWDLTLKDGSVYEFLVDFAAEKALLKSLRDRFGNRLTVTRDANRRVTQIRSPHGRWLDFTYDASHRITQVRDPLNRTVSYTYDASGRLWKVTDAAGGLTEFTYDSSHRMLTVKDPRTIVYLTNEYDANGRVFRQTLADSSTYQFAYTLDINGRVTQADMTNPRGYVRRVTFNAYGYALTETAAVGTSVQQALTYERESGTHLITRMTDALNRRTDYAYDALKNLTSVVELAGTADAATTSFTYEPAFNQLASITDPLSHTTSFTYDTAGRLTTITDPLNHQTTFTHNAAGQPVTVTTALNHTTQLAYDGGDLVSITNPLGQVMSRFFDAGGRLIQTIGPRGYATKYEYNNSNLLTRITDALNGQTQFTYDGNANLLTLTDARNKTTTWTYNSMDWVATRTDPLTRQESFLYDGMGNLTQWTDRKSQVTMYTYDPLDRRTFIGFGTTGTPPTYQSSITYTYDGGDRLTQLVDTAAGTITRTYDLRDRLTSETTSQGSVSYTYDAASRRATMTVAGQTAVSYGYDNADRLTSVTQGTASVSIGYDNGDRRTSLTLPNNVVIEYGYDNGSRLTGLTYKLGQTTLGTLTYGYDGAGQPTVVGGTWARTNLPAALTSTVYDHANQIATFGGTTLTYDANGNLTSDGVRTYTWNPRNEMTTLAGPVSANFAYDGFGRRMTKTVSGTTTQFLYDEWNPVQELVGGSPAANLLAGLAIDEFFTRTDSAGARHYLTDALRSTVALSDSAGTTQTEYTYEPFGGLTVSGATTSSTFAFTGREADGAGLLYFRARYHDPRLQRFVSEDPIGVAGGVNLFGYVANRPTLYADPLGLKPTPAFGASPGRGFSGMHAGGPGGLGGSGGGAGASATGARGNRGNGQRGGQCDALCQMARDISRRAGPMTEVRTYAEWVVLSAAGGVAIQYGPTAVDVLGRAAESVALNPTTSNVASDIVQGVAPIPPANTSQFLAGVAKEILTRVLRP